MMFVNMKKELLGMFNFLWDLWWFLLHGLVEIWWSLVILEVINDVFLWFYRDFWGV
jgi:hypothetical protein